VQASAEVNYLLLAYFIHSNYRQAVECCFFYSRFKIAKWIEWYGIGGGYTDVQVNRGGIALGQSNVISLVDVEGAL
jgi:hypothetical protein